MAPRSLEAMSDWTQFGSNLHDNHSILFNGKCSVKVFAA